MAALQLRRQVTEMNLEWADERCILCTLAPSERLARCSETADFTEEHLIPEAIGGSLTCHFLCQHCNSTLGQIEAHLKKDANVRCAIQALQGSLPELWASMSEGQSYLAKGPDGMVPAELKNGVIRVNSETRADGTLVLPAEDSPKAVRTMLRRRGATGDEISDAEMKFDELAEGFRGKVADGIEVLKSTVDAVYPALNSRRIDQLPLLKIAYEYLALHLRGEVFHQYYDPVRSSLSAGGVFPSCCSVQDLHVSGRKPEPFHGLAIKDTTGGLEVKIRLFGCLSYPVCFRGLPKMPTKPLVYMLHLNTKQEELVEMVEIQSA